MSIYDLVHWFIVLVCVTILGTIFWKVVEGCSRVEVGCQPIDTSEQRNASVQEALAINRLQDGSGITPHSDSYLMLESMRVAMREGYNPEWCLKDGESLHPYLETCQSITGIRYVASCYLSMLEDMSEEEL